MKSAVSLGKSLRWLTVFYVSNRISARNANLQDSKSFFRSEQQKFNWKRPIFAHLSTLFAFFNIIKVIACVRKTLSSIEQCFKEKLLSLFLCWLLLSIYWIILKIVVVGLSWWTIRVSRFWGSEYVPEILTFDCNTL